MSLDKEIKTEIGRGIILFKENTAVFAGYYAGMDSSQGVGINSKPFLEKITGRTLDDFKWAYWASSEKVKLDLFDSHLFLD